jgi:hypothetical protein
MQTQFPDEIKRELDSTPVTPELLQQMMVVVSTIKSGDFKHKCYSRDTLPSLVIRACQDNYISQAQMTTAILIWEAKKDFQDLSNFTVHNISNPEDKTLFLTYLELRKNNFKARVQDTKFLYDEYPDSEKFFVIFTIPESQIPQIYKTFNQL